MRHLHWRWVCLAAVAQVSVFLLHGWRWKLLLRPVANVPFSYCLEAVYVGLFASEVLPLRAGELIRCFLLSRESEVPLSVTFASALIERIFDGIWLIFGFVFCVQVVHLRPWVRDAGYGLGVFVVICGAILAYAMYARKQSLGMVFGWKWPRWFNTLIDDLHLIGHSRYLYFSFLISGGFMLAQTVPIYLLMSGSNLHVPWQASVTLTVLLRLASAPPQAPGNLGLFQLASSQTLHAFRVGTAHAKRFSMILWAVLTLPLILIGALALAISGINITHLHRDAAAAAQDRRRS